MFSLLMFCILGHNVLAQNVQVGILNSENVYHTMTAQFVLLLLHHHHHTHLNTPENAIPYMAHYDLLASDEYVSRF